MSPDHDRREVFLDARGNGRALRMTWHHEAGMVVLSLWREGVCAGTFRLPKTQVNEFIDALVDGLRDERELPVEEPRPTFMHWAFTETTGQHTSGQHESGSHAAGQHESGQRASAG